MESSTKSFVNKKDKLYFKITNKDECHNKFPYVRGLNKLIGPFNKKGSCVPGRLYFTKPKYIFEFISFGVFLRDVRLPVEEYGFQMVKDPDGDKYGANMIILGDKRSLFDVETIKYAISKGARLVDYVDNVENWALNHGAWNIIEYLISEHHIEEYDIVTIYRKDLQKNII